MSDLVKRCFDVAASLVGLIVAAPLLIITGLAVRVGLGRPVLFVQTRPGRDGVPFRMYKFRTMRDPRPDERGAFTDEKRLTRLGRVLRAASLDELPELVNVLLGQMSFVGPRPLLMEYLPLYSMEQARRHEVRPGITGWAQVHGRNTLDWDERFSMDVWYVDNRSPLLDLKILVMTVAKVVMREGISASGAATCEPFGGSAIPEREDGK